MIAVLLDACPTFAPAWRTFLNEWSEAPGDPPIYAALGDLARHLCGMLARGETAGFPGIFAAVERLLVHGDHYVQEAVCLGLLENLQNANVHATTEPAQFRPWLGPEAVRCWTDLNRFWHGEDTGSDRTGLTT